MTSDYLTVTELPGVGATAEQLSMLYTRYRLAAERSRAKDVLEVACGPGVGLGYLAGQARRVVGGDCSLALLRIGADRYRGRVPLIALDAHALPFRGGSFDVLVLFEALYYLARPEAFLAEARRVLRGNATLLLCTANRDWPGFNPSPHSHRYFSAHELHALLARAGFEAEVLAGFPARAETTRDRVLGVVRRVAVALRLVPRTMKGKERLKRLLFGRLTPTPTEVREGMAPLEDLWPVPGDGSAGGYKVLYAVARVRPPKSVARPGETQAAGRSQQHGAQTWSW